VKNFSSLFVRIAHFRWPEATAAGEDARATSLLAPHRCLRHVTACGPSLQRDITAPLPGVDTKKPGRQGKRPGACAIGKD
jgi:hypothetical protein